MQEPKHAGMIERNEQRRGKIRGAIVSALLGAGIGAGILAGYSALNTQATQAPRRTVQPLRRVEVIETAPVGELAVLLRQGGAATHQEPFWYSLPVVEYDGRRALLLGEPPKPPYLAEVLGPARTAGDVAAAASSELCDEYRLDALDPDAPLSYDGASIDAVLQARPAPPRKQSFLKELTELLP